MANEQDAGRDIKVSAGLVIGAVVVLVAGGYFLWSWMSAPAPVQSKVDLNRVSGASRGRSSETPAYRDLLKQFNQEGGSTAKSENNSFIASISMEQQPLFLSKPAEKAVDQPKPTARASSSTAESASGGSNAAKDKDDPRQKALAALLKRINPEPAADSTVKGLQTAQALGGGASSGDSAGNVSGYGSWSEGLPGGARLQPTSLGNGLNANGMANAYSPVEVVPPYWRGAGVIDLGVDSDNSTTPVLGKLSGPYAGAVLKATEGAKLSGDGVVIHFTEMAFKGVNYKVDAYALQDDTLLANVATDVNHRYMSRIVLPALLSGIGSVGQMYSQANTEVLTNGFATQTVRPGLPDGAAVVGSIAGGAADQAARVLTQDASRTPPTQVTVKQGQVVAIQFMRGVYAGDAIAPGRTGETVQSAQPAQATADPRPIPQSQPRTADQWRAQTQSRIQEQRMLQESQR